jgi:hypothetical protein
LTLEGVSQAENRYLLEAMLNHNHYQDIASAHPAAALCGGLLAIIVIVVSDTTFLGSHSLPFLNFLCLILDPFLADFH